MWLQVPSVALALLAATTSASNPLDQQTNQHRGLEAEGFGFSSYKSCECKSGRRQCLFIHGELHEKKDEKDDDLQTESDYFGDIKDHAPCCSSIKYASLDTMNTPWTDEILQKKVCHLALSMSKKSDVEEKVIKNTILVTHSMGALILAGAIANKTCSIDNSTAWVSMSAPMMGTMASDKGIDSCSTGDWDTFREYVGQCPVGEGMKSLAYTDGEHVTKKLIKSYERAQEAYSKYVTAAMCSNGYQGEVSVHQIKYAMLAKYIDHKSGKNDGLVTYESCRGGLDKSKFSDDPTDAFYVSKCNHADTKFLHGNDPIMDSKKPVRWFECAL